MSDFGSLIPVLGDAFGKAVDSTNMASGLFISGKKEQDDRQWQQNMYQKQLDDMNAMYGRQRKDSLADYDMMNQYNSPAEQMKRLKAAGLNPNLVYGHGAATQTAAQVKGSSPSAPSGREYRRVDLPTIPSGMLPDMGKYFDIQLVRANKDVAVQQALHIAGQTAKVGADTARSKYDLELAKKLQNSVIEKAAAEVTSLKAHTHVALDANERAAQMQLPTLREKLSAILKIRMDTAKSAQEIQAIKRQMNLVNTDEAIKYEDWKLKKSGIQPHDGAWMRLIQKWMQYIIKENYSE